MSPPPLLTLEFYLYVATAASLRSTLPIALLDNFIIWGQGTDIFFFLALEKPSAESSGNGPVQLERSVTTELLSHLTQWSDMLPSNALLWKPRSFFSKHLVLTTGAFSMRSAQTVPMVGTSKAVKRLINLVDVYQLLNVKFPIPLKDFRTDSSTT